MKGLIEFNTTNVFKLLDKALDRVVEFRQPVVDLGEGVKQLAEQVKQLAKNVAVIAHNQKIHHNMILTLASNADLIMAKMQESALDTKMPDIDNADVKSEDKLDVTKRRDSNKLN